MRLFLLLLVISFSVSAAEQLDPQEQVIRAQGAIQELQAQRDIANQRAAMLAAELAATQEKLKALEARKDKK